ncbi:uncharacterized protein [Epargyreus clarus]|uniref:uncharacterized protein n=1 Tax=Epargyreus clarus TaxID=520877 RepID=UPI003C2B4E19
MFMKCVLVLFALGSIDAQYYFGSVNSDCTLPRFENGRIRMRQRSKLAKFTCLPRYWLVGNKYATCRDGQWDVPLPVCVRPGCRDPERISNGLTMASHGGAWVHFFCMPDFKLAGSSVIYCDGRKWNSTAPTCIASKAAPQLSCDFEDQGICGWTQDELHDFDWTRRNSKTPSSIHFTGPSFDHTLGAGQYGYFMYIESSSRLENETARLISPIYEKSLTVNGCFSLSYHMYGQTCGGLRVYQKPDDVALPRIMGVTDEERQKYIIFEKWGNLGDIWYNAVVPLKNISVDFQIVIEGVRGRSYTSDIAIDDVAILQGENCTEAARYATTPPTPTPYYPESCVDRCNGPRLMGTCSCTLLCISRGDCCPDYVDVCIFSPDTSSTTSSNDAVTQKSSKEEAPQTLKLVAVTTESTTTTTTPKPTPRITTPTPKPTTKATKPTNPPTTKVITTTKPPTTKITTTKATTTKPTTVAPKTTKNIVTTTKVAKMTTVATTTTTSTTQADKLKVLPKSDNMDVGKHNKEINIESRKSNHELFKATRPSTVSTGAKVGIVILILTMSVMIGLVIRASYYSTRVRIALARFRGHQTRDPEVRYLSSDVDDD